MSNMQQYQTCQSRSTSVGPRWESE